MANLHQLITRARMGDRQAMNQLFTRWYPQVFNIAYQYFSDAERAREVSQQTFLIMQQRLVQLRDPDSFKVWLYRIVINQCHTEFRQKKTRERSQGNYQQVRPQQPEPTPEELYQQQERSKIILAALQQLPEEQREVIIMKEYRGLTFREIAEVLGISENTAKSRMYYGLKALRKFFLKTNLKKEIYHG